MNTENFFTEDEMNRLPKWAQSKAKVLQMRLGEAREEVTRLKDNPKSNTMAGREWDNQQQYLKDDEVVTFFLEHGQIEATIKDGSVSIHGSYYGQSNLCVFPQVSNGLILSFVNKP